MSCYKFSEEDLGALKKGERLFMPGIDPEKYDLWDIEYMKAPNYFGEYDKPERAVVSILAIDGETEKEASNRFKTWCDRVYGAVSFAGPSIAIGRITYRKAEENEDDC